MRKLLEDIQKALTPDLLKGKWIKQTHPLEGHCYVATEALYHAIGSKDYKPMCASYYDDSGRCTHWWLVNKKTGEILDPTREQYGEEIPPYHLGKGKGFLTKLPSKRAKIVLERCSFNSAEECLSYKEEVLGSNPRGSTEL